MEETEKAEQGRDRKQGMDEIEKAGHRRERESRA